MKTIFIAFALFSFSAHAAEVPASPLRELLKFVMYSQPYNWDSLDEHYPSKEYSVLLMSQKSVQFCYVPGKRAEAAAALEEMDLGYGYVNVEEDSPVIGVMGGYNYSFTEFEFRKDVPECSNEWMKEQLE